MFQIITVSSFEPVANRLESYEKLTAFTDPVCSVKIVTRFQVVVFQINTCLYVQLAKRLESCEKLTAYTGEL